MAVVGGAGYGAIGLASSGHDSKSASSSSPISEASAAPVPAAAEALTAQTAAAMLLEYSIVNCTPSRIVFGAPSDFPILDTWESQWLSSGRYVMSSTDHGPDTSEDVLTHVNPVNPTLTVRMAVRIHKYAQVWFKQREYFGCLVMPVAVNVLDTTVDPSGKTATVIFRYGAVGRTDFGNDMMFRAYPATNAPFTQAQQDRRWIIEHTAYFQKLDAIGWRVESIR
ncbi:MAG TPA: hypothetical protein VII56_10695 [Rhizomicrobium sp.]